MAAVDAWLERANGAEGGGVDELVAELVAMGREALRTAEQWLAAEEVLLSSLEGEE